MIQKAYKYRIYPTKAQSIFLQKNFDAVRFVYNDGLRQMRDSYEAYSYYKNIQDEEKKKAIKEKIINRYDLQQQIKESKAMRIFDKEGEEIENWLNEACSSALIYSVMNLDRAFKNFFARVKKNNGKAGYPKFKSKKNRNQSFQLQDCKIENGKLHIQKCKGINIVMHRALPENSKIKTTTLIQTASGECYVSILCEINMNLPQKESIAQESDIVGIDIGISNFIATSKKIDGKTFFENHRNLKKSLKKLKHIQRRIKNKKRGSKNREKQRVRIAKLHRKIYNRRNEYIHEVTHKLINDNQIKGFAVEDLNIKGMTKNKKLARDILDVGMGEFFRVLKYKCEWTGKHFVEIGRFDATSKLCSCCGWKKENLTLSDRTFYCEKCNNSLDRDYNASLNIAKLGFQKLVPELCGEFRSVDDNVTGGGGKSYPLAMVIRNRKSNAYEKNNVDMSL